MIPSTHHSADGISSRRMRTGSVLDTWSAFLYGSRTMALQLVVLSAVALLVRISGAFQLIDPATTASRRSFSNGRPSYPRPPLSMSPPTGDDDEHQEDHQTGGAMPTTNIYVMVNGMPGPMATAAAEACLRKGLLLSPVAMTGPDVPTSTISVVDPITERSSQVRLIPSTQRDELEASIVGLHAACEQGDHSLLVIDFTHPSAVNDNARFYIDNQLPFVMGTTGGDRVQLMKDVQEAQWFSVIAPNMGKQIVAMQAALQDLAQNYPGAFAGYKLQVTESHQKSKADTSGTAKAVIDSLKLLTDNPKYSYDDIVLLRDDESSLAFGVPPEALSGHAFHTYTLTSPDGSVQFQLQHNVAGRTVYAEGTADAVQFLAKKIREATSSSSSAMKNQRLPPGRVYNMIDVLKEGALE